MSGRFGGESNNAFQDDNERPLPRYNEATMRAGGGAKDPTSSSSSHRIPSIIISPKGKDEESAESGSLPPERGQWSNQMEFLLSCIAMSVGLGNIWRFPFTAYNNGGGAFLIPYLIVLVFVGRPIYFLELCLGQFCSLSQVKVWRLNPFFKGVGYASAFATFAVMTYYCSIMALTIFYFVVSFQKTLPWSACDPSWAQPWGCNDTELNNNASMSRPEAYFVNEVLQEKNNIDDGIGFPEWRMTLCLLAAWLVILFTLIRGVKSSGKVAYFTALFPYIVLFTLLVRGVTLDGALDGIKYFIEPHWEKLYEPAVWYAAVTQCFYSLNTGFGSVIMFSSYNPFRHNIYRDSWILSFLDTFTSLLAGFTIFAVLGYLSKTTGIPIEKVVQGGTGLAFVSYPEAISKFTFVPQLFAVLFFLMLFTLGIGSASADAGAVISIFADRFPKFPRWKITTILCTVSFCLGLVYVTPGGQFMLELVDYFGAAFVIFITSVLEVIGVMWVYGLSNFVRDVEFMLKIKIGLYWKICWGFVIPVGLSVILVYALATAEPLEYREVRYPTWALAFGWTLGIVALSVVPFCAIRAMWKSSSSTFFGKLQDATSPTDEWGPQDLKLRKEWIAFKNL